MLLQETPTPQHTSTVKCKSTKICTIPQLQSCKEKCNVRSIRDTHLNAGFTFAIRPTIIRLSFTQRLILIVAFMAVLSWRKPTGPRIMRKLWRNLKPNHVVNFREICASEQTSQSEEEEQKRFRERGIEAQLRAAAQRAHRDQEDATDPMVAPQDHHDVHQSVRVLELQNSDLWLRPTDLGTFLSS